jgi:hypothetical protein
MNNFGYQKACNFLIGSIYISYFVSCPTLLFPPELFVGLAGGLISYSFSGNTE